MPKRVKRNTSGNETLVESKEERPAEETQNPAPAPAGTQAETDEKATAEAKVETVEDPVIDHLLHDLNALTAKKVADDARGMAFYVALVIRDKHVVPALVRGNSRTGYVRSLVPIPPDKIEPIVKGLLEIAKERGKYESQVKDRMKEIEKKRRIEQVIKRLQKEGFSPDEIKQYLEQMAKSQS